MVLLSPLVVLAVLNQSTKIYGINLINIVATCGCTKSIFHLRRQFMAYYFMHFSKPVYEDAIERINKHKENGAKIVILSASPTWLLYGFIKKINIRPDNVIGSHQHVRFNSIVTTDFCYGENKVKMARDLGLDLTRWIYGYTDSPEDIPFLRYCLNKTSINANSKRVKQKFQHCFHENIKSESWH
jgi:phosphoserine phosphatase